MSCQSFEETLSELASNREPDQTNQIDLRAGVLDHLDSCTVCAQILQESRALSHRLNELATEMKSLTASNDLEVALRKSFRARMVGPLPFPARTVTDEIARSRWNRWNLSIAGLAAVLLILTGITALRQFADWQSQPLNRQPEIAAIQIPTTPFAAGTVAPGYLLSNSNRKFPVNVQRKTPYRRTHPFRNESVARKQPDERTTVNQAVGEVVTEFLPLAYAGPLNLEDGGQLVRVEMSRAAMFSMGLPVNMDRYRERVKADILLGADGLAQAIRFVQ